MCFLRLVRIFAGGLGRRPKEPSALLYITVLPGYVVGAAEAGGVSVGNCGVGGTEHGHDPCGGFAVAEVEAYDIFFFHLIL